MVSERRSVVNQALQNQEQDIQKTCSFNGFFTFPAISNILIKLNPLFF